MAQGGSRADVAAGAEVPRRLYGDATTPLPVRTHPRKRLMLAILGLTASGLFAVALPLAIVLLAQRLGTTIEETLRRTGVSLVVTLWIFHQVALSAVGFYSSAMVLLKKAEAGAGWIAFGVFATGMCTAFLTLGGMAGAAFGIAGGAILLGAGIFDLL